MALRLRHRIKKAAMVVTALFILTVVGAAGFYVYVQADGNLHVVEKNYVYRSRQLSGPELEQVINTHGIRSILNLRGTNPDSDWYDDELAVSTARHMVHYDYGISANRQVTPRRIEEILHIIKDAPKPILIHCMAGADRTGLISAVFLFSQGEPPEQAAEQLSLRYGHFPYLWSGTDAMDKSFADYVRLGQKNEWHKPITHEKTRPLSTSALTVKEWQ